MRKKQKFKRILEPDIKYNNITVAKLIKTVMKHGKLTIAEKIVYGTLASLEKSTGSDPVVTFELAIKNVSPMLEVRSKRIGGANYQVPREVRGERKLALAFRWILDAARARKGKSMANRLAEEILLAAKNEGNAIKKKNDTQKMAEANKAFAHFAW